MELRLALPDLDLGPVAAGLLPAGAEILGLHLDEDSLRLDARAPIVGDFTLLAAVSFKGPSLTLSRFRVKGGMLARAFLRGELQRRIGALDWSRGPLRAWGEADGERLRVAWGKRKK